ncbi:MAG: hypothetical protein L6R40_007689 [Gallowayella cf. fulva]|nr:MAG: hypothetical protein L6R40_007689 [Xanthomendoza cf. fulva]
MAGGAAKYRHLSRSSSHRQALLRNLVTSLFQHESIKTTWPKAKEAQRLAEKIITLGKKNTSATRRRAQEIFYPNRIQTDKHIHNKTTSQKVKNSPLTPPPPSWLQHPLTHLDTLFTTLRARYLHRPGGYTRVLRIEPLNKHHDQGPSAILELVDGPKDMRFHMTAKTLVRERASEEGVREITARNVAKVTRYRENGEEELEREVQRMEKEKDEGGDEAWESAKWKVDERPREGWKLIRYGVMRQKT